MKVKDVFTSAEYFVWDASISRTISKSNVIFARPLGIGSVMLFEGATIVMPGSRVKELTRYVRDGLAEYNSKLARDQVASRPTTEARSDETLDTYLKERSLSIIQFLKPSAESG